MYVAGNVMFLGKTVTEISRSLNQEYKEEFKKKTFSWNDTKMRWNMLTDMEKEIISEVAADTQSE
ncbi:MAG: hypothetical protein ABIT58_05070 [Ferruginibacter sp.]